MNEHRKSTVAVSFSIGAVVGTVIGTVFGILIGPRAFTALLHAWSMITREHDDRPRFELFLQ